MLTQKQHLYLHIFYIVVTYLEANKLVMQSYIFELLMPSNFLTKGLTRAISVLRGNLKKIRYKQGCKLATIAMS